MVDVISPLAPGLRPTAAAPCPAAYPCQIPGPIPAINAKPAPIAEHAKTKPSFVILLIVISSLNIHFLSITLICNKYHRQHGEYICLDCS